MEKALKRDGECKKILERDLEGTDILPGSDLTGRYKRLVDWNYLYRRFLVWNTDNGTLNDAQFYSKVNRSAIYGAAGAGLEDRWPVVVFLVEGRPETRLLNSHYSDGRSAFSAVLPVCVVAFRSPSDIGEAVEAYVVTAAPPDLISGSRTVGSYVYQNLKENLANWIGRVRVIAEP